MKEEYTQIPWPSGDVYKAMRCACCGGQPEAWQYITKDDQVQRVVMCETSELSGESDDLGIMNDLCPFNMPPMGFYCGTLREAVTWWNRVNGLLVAKRLANALKSMRSQ
jgi:hypothetical protein